MQTVLVDFALAGADMESWIFEIRAIQPEMKVIGTGGVGSETALLRQGVSRVLRKPWRINELLDAFEFEPTTSSWSGFRWRACSGVHRGLTF